MNLKVIKGKNAVAWLCKTWSHS